MAGFGGNEMSGFVGDQMAGVPNWLLLAAHPELAKMMGLGGMPGSAPPSSGGVPGVPAEPTLPLPGGVGGVAGKASAAGTAGADGGGYRKVEPTRTEWEDLYRRLTEPKPQPTRLQSFTALAAPVLQAMGAAFAGPSRGHRFGQPFLGAALAGGGGVLQTLAGRPQAKWEQGLEQAGREYAARVGIAKATTPTAKEETLYDVFDKMRRESVKATAAQIQAEPERYTLVPPKPGAEQAPHTQTFNVGGQDVPHQWNAVTKTWEPITVTEPSGPELNPATTGPNQPWLMDAMNPAAAGKFVVHPSVPTKVQALAPKGKVTEKFETLDQRYSAAVESGDLAEQATILKAMRKKAVATHISEPKGPTPQENSDQRRAEAFDAARLLLEQVDPKVKASGDPGEVYKASLRELYRRAAQPGVSARTKALVGDVERQLYRQSGAGFRALTAEEMGDEIDRVNSNPYLSEEEKKARVDQLLKRLLRK